MRSITYTNNIGITCMI